MLTSLKKTFSVEYIEKHIIIHFLGIKFTIRTTKKPLDTEFQEYHKKHLTVINNLRKEVKSRKLNVCFLVSETSKWNAQNLYDEMEKSDFFEPFILVTSWQDANNYQTIQHTVNYFKNLCKNVQIGFNLETNEALDIKFFKPDIVFYQQPWSLSANQNPKYVSDFALPYYFSYAAGEAISCLKDQLHNFYIMLQKYFIFSNVEYKQYTKELNYKMKNISVTGHPKLDIYKDYNENNYEHKYVIYAPHHSFEQWSLNYATFRWNGAFILEWAKAHPEFEWIFKPHPRFKEAVIKNNIMTKDEAEEYYSEWGKIGKPYFDGSYFDLFKNSKCLITDCGSFLIEYLPTNQPVIHMRNPLGTDYIESIKVAMKSYYDVWNPKELEKTLNEILIESKDNKKKDRLNSIQKLNLSEYNSTEKIINELKKDLGLNNIL